MLNYLLFLYRVPGESSFTARAKTPTSNQFKIGLIVYHCRTICKNFKIFNETGKE
jgi:hypothetical protein